MECEIILIGNELLIGKIQDSNGIWMIHQLLPFGIRITRIITIPDDLDAIASTIQEAIKRKPAYIFTSGGLGPTFDDMTLEGIARGLNPPQKCIENPQAIQLIQDAYNKRFGKNMELTSNRRKMGTLPQGAIPLTNRVGTAPGVLIPANNTNGETIIVCLPGVPPELIAIFSDHILPIFQQKMKDGHFYQAGFTFQDLGESKFTELIYQIKDEYPEIWIKTHPKSKEKSEVELHLTSFSSKPEIPDQIKALYLRLQRHVINSNGKIVEEHPLLP